MLKFAECLQNWVLPIFQLHPHPLQGSWHLNPFFIWG